MVKINLKKIIRIDSTYPKALLLRLTDKIYQFIIKSCQNNKKFME